MMSYTETKLPSHSGQPSNENFYDNLNVIFKNLAISTHRFGDDIETTEVMGEPYFCYTFPQQLLKLWIVEEEILLEEILSVGELSEEWKRRQTKLMNEHLSLIDIYGEALLALKSKSNAGISLRKTIEKEESVLEFAPINLNLQRLIARNTSLDRTIVYDVITVGSFSANSLKYSAGGLHELLQEYNQRMSPNEKTLRCDVHIEDLRCLRKEIFLLLRQITLQQKEDSLLSIITRINEKANQLLDVVPLSLVEEAYLLRENMLTASLVSHNNTITSSAFLRNIVDKDEANVSTHLLTFPVIYNVFDYFFAGGKKTLQEDGPLKSLYYKRRLEEEWSELFLGSCYKVTDEPEPLELIQLNVKASLICLSTKINSFSALSQNVKHLDNTSEEPTQLFSPNGIRMEITSPEPFPINPPSKCFSNVEKSSCDDQILSFDEIDLKDNMSSHNVHSSDSGLAKVQNTASSALKNEDRVSSSSKYSSTENEHGSELLSEVRPCVQKLWQAADGLMRAARLTRSVFRLQEEGMLNNTIHNHSIKYRRDICFSQALTAVVCGLLTRIWCTGVGAKFVSILTKVGPLAVFEGLLTYYKGDAGRISDMMVALDDLRNVVFVLAPAHLFSPVDGGCEGPENVPTPIVVGRRKALRVLLPAPEKILSELLYNSSTSASFRVTPIFFNIGINEEATFAAKLNKDGPQYRINLENYDHLVTYWKSFESSMPHPHEDQGRMKESVNALITQLGEEVNRQQQKNVSVLHLAAKICNGLEGLRFTSCKSAKDRTAMSVTLEEVFALRQQLELSESQFKPTLDYLRVHGTRLKNCEKNIGHPKYAFSSVQLALFPSMYKPPSGTYGANPT